jgi:hypothetical protein
MENKVLCSDGNYRVAPTKREVERQLAAEAEHQALVASRLPGGKRFPTKNELRQNRFASS